jgi:ABC-type nitrate/sulfonate/bicarbonate transport system permease component
LVLHVLLNLPALVIIVLAYTWAGLTETAAVAAVALNKLSIATVTIRARSPDLELDEMAHVFRMSACDRFAVGIKQKCIAWPRGAVSTFWELAFGLKSVA